MSEICGPYLLNTLHHSPLAKLLLAHNIQSLAYICDLCLERVKCRKSAGPTRVCGFESIGMAPKSASPVTLPSSSSFSVCSLITGDPACGAAGGSNGKVKEKPPPTVCYTSPMQIRTMRSNG